MIAWSPEHVSTYELTYEPATPFGRALVDGRMEACDEDLAADMIEAVEARLSRADYERYEISSYARSGARSIHNARYWQRQAVLGLGLGAHSTEARSVEHPHGARRANPRDLETWLARLDQDPARTGDLERLSAETARGEAVFLGLRQSEGLCAGVFEAEFGAGPRHYFSSEIEAAVAAGWLVESGQGGLRLSSEGRLVADSVAEAFVGSSGRDS